MKRFTCDNEINVYIRKLGYQQFHIGRCGEVWALMINVGRKTQIGWIA